MVFFQQKKEGAILFTIQDFLALPSVKGGRVMTCQTEAKERIISQISVQEMPVEHFLQPEELILTTAIGCYESMPVFLEFLEEARRAEVAAVVITRKEDDFYLPPQVLAFGETHHLPILMVLWEARFGDMVEQTITAIHRLEQAEEQRYEKLKEALLSAFVASQSLEDAAQILASFLETPVAILDAEGNCKGQSHNFLPSPQQKQLPLWMEGRRYGTVVLEKGQDSWNEMLLEQAWTLPLVLFFGREETIHTTIWKLKNNFLLSLVKEGLTEEKKGLARRLGFFLETSYVCMVGHFQIPQEVFWKEEEVEKLLLDKAKQKKRQVLGTVHQQQILLFLHQKPLPTEEQVASFLDEMEEALQSQYPQCRCWWGIGEIAERAADFQKDYETASFALTLCQHSPRRRLGYKEGVLYRMVQQLNQNPLLVAQAKEALAPLRQEGAMGETLLETMQVYLEQNQNVTQTARALHIHRQSLLYRLEKVEERLGISLHRHTDLFLLELYLRMEGRGLFF